MVYKKLKIIFIFLSIITFKFITFGQQATSIVTKKDQKSKIIGEILFTKSMNIDANLYLKALNDNWSLNAKIVNNSKDKFTFKSQGFKVEIAKKNFSYPSLNLINANKGNSLWPTILKPSLKNKAYYEVTIESNMDDFLIAHKLFSKVCNILLSTNEVISIYYNLNQLLIPKEFYTKETMVMKKEVLPLRNWLTINSICAGEFTNSYTKGLKYFGYQELEIINSKQGATVNENIIYNVASFVLEKKVILTGNERLNIVKDSSYMTYISEGIHVPEKTVKIVVK